jgi:molybdate transport system regulatory protein
MGAARTRAVEAEAFRLRLQVMRGAEGALGPGKAALLEAIAELGSISAAGRVLEISYRRCWLLVEEMNRDWAEPLVERRRGGKEQGARLTLAGEEVIAAYRALEARLVDVVGSAPEAMRLRDRLAVQRTETAERDDRRSRGHRRPGSAP